jgi:hypothetical protein
MVFDERRRPVRNTCDRDVWLEQLRFLFDVPNSRFTSILRATRGERLALNFPSPAKGERRMRDRRQGLNPLPHTIARNTAATATPGMNLTGAVCDSGSASRASRIDTKRPATIKTLPITATEGGESNAWGGPVVFALMAAAVASPSG